MKGLFLKDFRYLLLQKSFVGLILIIGLALSDRYYFALGYLTFMGSLLGFISITMDNQTNGLSFLFTLPISRKQYVTEKYLFSFLMMFLSCIISLAAVFFTRWLKHYNTSPSEIIFTALGCCACLVFFLSLMLPLTLKFNEERARLAYLIALGVFIVAMVPIVALINLLDTHAALSFSLHLSTTALTAIGCLIVLLCLLISYCVSLHIIKHRDF
ncbi:MAG: ABC-2 transporter permease [Peptococcaceae bacterium]|nr:ABC-2 transporter permease [Peptococcaceae bacterium]